MTVSTWQSLGSVTGLLTPRSIQPCNCYITRLLSDAEHLCLWTLCDGLCWCVLSPDGVQRGWLEGASYSSTTPATALPAKATNLINTLRTLLTSTSRYPSSPSLLFCSNWPPHGPSNILSIPLSQGFCASCSLVLECSSPWWLLGSHSRFTQVCSSITLAERLSLLCIEKHPLLPPPPWASTPFPLLHSPISLYNLE